jgi:hypothetical protein
MMLIKNLGRHSLHPLRRILSWGSITRLEWFLPSWQGLQREEDFFSYTSQYRGFRWNKRYKVHSLLPHHRSWGSGQWMCTWTANSRQILLAVQIYIPISVQRSNSKSSKDWVMGVSVARVLPPVYFRASSRRHQRRRKNSLLGEERNRWERWASGRVTKTSWGKNKRGGDVELGWI